MRIFVTGGAGFIGSNLVDTLLAQDHTVTVYDNLSSGDKTFLTSHQKNTRFTFKKADLLKPTTLTTSMKDHDLVIHLAANPYVRLGETQTDLDLTQGTIATHNVLEAMRTNHINDIIYSSSSVVYGETTGQPLPETYGPTLPISLYGAGKLGGEGLISAYVGTFGLHAWIYRFANVVGRHGTHGVIVDFIHKLHQNPHTLEILGNGTQRKPYLYVTDCVNGMLHGYHHSHNPIQVYNLSCTTTTTVTRIAELITQEMGLTNVQFNYTGGDRGWKGDVPTFQLDPTTMNQLGWTATYTSDQAVQKAIQDTLQAKI
jgi:UDP-glucose 4-epimerase